MNKAELINTLTKELSVCDEQMEFNAKYKEYTTAYTHYIRKQIITDLIEMLKNLDEVSVALGGVCFNHKCDYSDSIKNRCTAYTFCEGKQTCGKIES